MSCASPPYPCSGPSTSATLTPSASRMVRACTRRRSTAAGCASSPTRAARSSAPRVGCVASRSSPVRTPVPYSSAPQRLTRTLNVRAPAISGAGRLYAALRKRLRTLGRHSRSACFCGSVTLKSFHTMRRILVVDDEENIRLVLRTLLKKHGFDVEVADSGEAALGLLEAFDPDVILTDVRMPRMGGLDLLATLRAKQHPATVIVMSAYGNVDLALEAMKAGAYDYVSKPFKPDEVVLALRKAEERETLRRENRALREQIQKENQFESILAKSKEMQEIFRTITKIADFKTTVLITGESGTGKELVARAIHTRSSRS